MKPKLILFLLLFAFAACTVERNGCIVGDMFLSPNGDSVKEFVAYPKCQNSLTRSKVQSSGWEFWQRVTLASGETPYTPWNPIYSSGAIPYEVRMDIQPKDGWDLIAHTVNGYGERGMNYLIFHNHYTGILKVFYYLESYSSNLQNTALWKLHFENPQSFLAFTDEYARLSTDKSVRDIYLSNITNDDSKGYTAGWNCFQVELAYNPDFTDGSLQIIPMSMTTSSVKIDGSLDASTKGMIISTTTTNPLKGVVKGAASLVGSKAEEWLGDAVKKAKFGDKIKKALTSGAGSLVTAGVGAALGSFVGAFSKTTQTTQTVQLNTVGKVELQGEIKTLQTGLIMPLSMSISVKDVGRLGVWCLTKKPSVLVNPYVDMDISQAPIETYIPQTPDGHPGARSEFDTFSDFISLFNIKFDTKEGNQVSLYHRFIPYLKWDYSRFDDHLYLEEYPNVPIEKKN